MQDLVFTTIYQLQKSEWKDVWNSKHWTPLHVIVELNHHWAELGKNLTNEISNKIAKLANEFFSTNEHFPCLNQISMPNVEKYKRNGWWKTYLDHNKGKYSTGKKL